MSIQVCDYHFFCESRIRILSPIIYIFVIQDTIKKRPNVVLNLKISDLALPFVTSTYDSTLQEMVSDLIPIQEEKEEAANRSARNKFLFHGDSSDEDHQSDKNDGDYDHDAAHELRSSRADEADRKSMSVLVCIFSPDLCT